MDVEMKGFRGEKGVQAVFPPLPRDRNRLRAVIETPCFNVRSRRSAEM